MNITNKMKGVFNVIRNWKSYRNIVYLLSLFPVGTATFTIAVTLVSVSVSLIFAPAWMWSSDPVTWGSWTFDPFPYSPLCTIVGILLLPVSLYFMNATTGLSRRLLQNISG